MSYPSQNALQRYLVAFADGPNDSDADPLLVEALLPCQLSDAAALAALVEAAAIDAGMEFDEFLADVSASRPKEWEPPKSKGGAPLKNDWKDEYGISAVALGAKIKLRLFIYNSLRAIRPKAPKMTAAAATRQTLVQERAKPRREFQLGVGLKTRRKHALPDARIKADAEKLRQALRGKHRDE